MVARRRIEETDPEPTLLSLERYAYRAWHTNLPLTPVGVWHFYDGRAGMERRIREIREHADFPMMPTTLPETVAGRGSDGVQSRHNQRASRKANSLSSGRGGSRECR
jgi:hypothetical protein